MSGHVSEFTCLVYIVTCVHPLQVVVFCVLYHTILYRLKSAESLFQAQNVWKQV